MKTLYGQTWYKPREIAQLGLIQNSLGDAGTENSHLHYIRKVIKDGTLKARNYSRGKRPHYLVSEKSIKEFNRKVFGKS